MTCLHLRAWSRANSLVPADGDKVKEAFQVRLADPKRLPIPLGREAPFAPLRGPWNPFVLCRRRGPVGTVFLFRRAVFRAWIDILSGKGERLTIILARPVGTARQR
jgi:hypothetical protein